MSFLGGVSLGGGDWGRWAVLGAAAGAGLGVGFGLGVLAVVVQTG